MNTPTKITFTRIIVTVALIATLFVLSFFNFETPLLGNTRINLVFLIIAVVFVVVCYTDHLDGYLARKHNQITDLGKFLDPVADKLLINSMVIFLIAPQIFAPYAKEQIVNFNMWCAILIVARDIIVDALRFVAAQRNKVIAANIFGKLKTVFQMVTLVIVLLNGFPFNYFDATWPVGLHISDFMVYITTLTSVVSGIIYVCQNIGVFKNEK